MVRIALLVTLIVGVARPADACPPGPCNKYRNQHMPHMTVPAHATGYTRRITMKMPRLTRARVVAVLTGVIWDPVFAASPNPNVRMLAPKPVRFVDARRVTRVPARSDIRTVMLRRIEVRDGEAWIEIDGQVFVLELCDGGLPDVCLGLRADLSFDEPVEDAQFAKPPG